jgi:hypothetical protein
MLSAMASRTHSESELRRLFAQIMLGVTGLSGVVGCGAHTTGSDGVNVTCGEEIALDGGLPDANTFVGADSGCCLPGNPNGNNPCCSYEPTAGQLSPAECTSICGQNFISCSVDSAGPRALVFCRYECIGGRRPQSYRSDGQGARSPGRYFASLATLERASVLAFRRMARELACHGAPRRLVKAAERAAREEVRHARGAASLAKRFGARPAGFEADVRGERTLEEIATENAVEGCVLETYGALVAAWQARAAADPAVRAHMVRIAREETGHAALAWKTAAWARGRLGRDARKRVEAAREKALRSLVDEVARARVDAEVGRIAGVPDARHAASLVKGLAAALS